MDDLISRQAAIDALAKNMPSLTTPDGCGQFDHDIYVTDEAYVDCMQIIHDMPSAQSEPIKINIDDFNKEDLERFKKELGNTPITVLPAQSDIIRCRNCKFASGDSRICMNFGHSPIRRSTENETDRRGRTAQAVKGKAHSRR